MSWFEPSAFASLAKNAIKEAQKTIDKALDIHDGQENLPVTKDVKSQSVEDAIKGETEMFFKTFERSKGDKYLSNISIPDEVEDVESNKAKSAGSESKNTSKLAGSIWGSFAESFFENTIANAKELVSSNTIADAIFPEEVDVSHVSNISDSHLHSSNSSSVIELSGNPASPLSLENIPNVFLDEYTREDRPKSREDYTSPVKDCDFDWGWDSSIIVMKSDSSPEDLDIQKIGSCPVEESLVDDLMNNDDFAHIHLTFENPCSIDDQKSNPENEFHESVLGGAFCEPSTIKLTDAEKPSISLITTDKQFDNKCIDLTTSNSIQKLGICDSNTSSNFVDSIIIINSGPTSPFESPKSPVSVDVPLLDSPSPLHLISDNVQIQNALGSCEVMDSNTDLNSPSSNSIELLTPTSSDSFTLSNQQSSPLLLTENISLVPTGNSGSIQITQQLLSDAPMAPETIFLADESVKCLHEKIWSQDEIESIAITKQPISVASHQKLSPFLAKDVEDKIDTLEENQSHTTSYTSEEGSTSESIHSTSTSSTHTVIDTNISSSEEIQIMNLSEISDRCEQGEELLSTDALETNTPLSASQLRTRGVLSMNPLTDITLNICSGDDDNNKFTKLSQAEHFTNNEHEIKVIENELSQCSKVVSSEEIFSVGPPLSYQRNIVEKKITPSTSLQLWDEVPTIDNCSADAAKRKEQSEIHNLLIQEICDESKENSNIMEAKELIIEGEPSEAERELSPSSSDRSDALKICSSGHSSADEVETTTSSDIEVISSPSMDGSNGTSSRLYNMPTGVPSKVWLTSQKGHCSIALGKGEAFHSFSTSKKDSNNTANEKVETFPSSMTTSFTSISESDGDGQHASHSELLQLEASRITQVLLQDINLYDKGHYRNKSTVSETSESSSEPQSPEVDKLYKKITQLTDILEARETKVLELSHTNSTLLDSNQALKSRIKELEMLKIGSDATESIREEFTQRLVTMERKFQQALREKEFAKRQLEECVTEAATRRSNADVAKELDEKNLIIQELRHEGEKLSKQQLNYSNIIKKLRTKEKECETCIKDQKEKIENQSAELDRFRKQLNAKEEVERCQIDAIRQLTVVNQRLEVEVKDLRAENAEAEGKLTALKEALDSAYREIADMQRAVATRDAEAYEQTLSADVSAQQKMEMAVLDATKQNRREQETLLAQILELQDSLSQTEVQSNRMERQMKHEISDLQKRLSDSEARAEDLSNSVSSATRSLLRQIENIQAGHNIQRATWDSLEESLNKRLNEALSSTALVAKREREAKEQHMVLLETVSSLQSQVSTLQAENSKLVSELETLTVKASELENTKSKEAGQLEAMKRSFTEEILEVKRDRDILEQQLKIEKLAINAEKRKALILQEQLKEKDRKLGQFQLSTAAVGESRLSSPRSSPTPSLSRLSITGSVNESFGDSHFGDEVFDSTWVNTKGSVYDNLRGNSAATVDVLTSTLRQREGELNQLQAELIRLESQKESLAQELVHTSRKIIELSSQVQDYDKMKDMHLDVQQKYNALLQMYGEKVEEVDELKLDLADVKEMYKLQIDQLMRK